MSDTATAVSPGNQPLGLPLNNELGLPPERYVPVMERGHQDPAHSEMLRLLDLSARQAAEIERLRADIVKLQEPVEDMAAWRLRFTGAVVAVEAEERERIHGMFIAHFKGSGEKFFGIPKKESEDDLMAHAEDEWQEMLARPNVGGNGRP